MKVYFPTTLSLILVFYLALVFGQQCTESQIDCSTSGQLACCQNATQTCVRGSDANNLASSLCCANMEGQSASCCLGHSGCQCIYAPQQQCCGTPGSAWACGSDSTCCPAVNVCRSIYLSIHSFYNYPLFLILPPLECFFVPY